MSALKETSELEHVYPAFDADLQRPISESFVDQIISDAGSAREKRSASCSRASAPC